MSEETTEKALLYRIEDVKAALGLGRTSIYNLVRNDPTFPKPIQLTKRAVAWRREEIERWVRRLPARPLPADPIAAEVQ